MSDYQPHSMLVTGGAGFIGCNFIRYVLSHEPHIQIVNLDKLTYAGSFDNLEHLSHPDRHYFIQGDIADANLVKHILQDHDIDTIVHFAAESHVDRSIDSPSEFLETNVMGTFVLLEAARREWCSKTPFKQKRFHHVSTDEVYGSLNADSPLFNEETAYQPRSPYSASKAASDHFAQAYYHTYQLPVTLSHCSNNYGPYQHAEKLIPTIIQACIQKKPVPIYGNGKNIRDWLYVEDHCRGIMAILKKGKPGETYNMGGNNEWENIAIAQYICQQLNSRMPHIEFVTDRKGHDFRYAIDTTKMKKQLHWKPEETLHTGIAKTIGFYLKQYKKKSVIPD
jgi:dTDP-glucose 4,6-dehydratase